MMDAPVSGGTGAAQSGTLSVIVGGPAETFAASEDLFRAMGKNVFHVGDLGHGLAMKLINNMLGQIATVAIAEALVFGKSRPGSTRERSSKWSRQHRSPACSSRTGCRASFAATSRRAARSTFRTRTRNWKPATPSARRAAADGQCEPAGLPDGTGPRAQQGRRLAIVKVFEKMAGVKIGKGE